MKKIISIAILLILCISISIAFVGCDENIIIGKIGESITNSDGLTFTLISCEDTKQLGSGTLVDTTDKNFVLLTIKVENNSNQVQNFSNSCADLYDSENTKYLPIASTNIGFIISADIRAGMSKTFQVAFETPKMTVEEKYTVKIGYNMYTKDNKRVVFDLSIKDNDIL